MLKKLHIPKHSVAAYNNGMQKMKSWLLGLVGSVLSIGSSGYSLAGHQVEASLVEQLKAEGLIIEVTDASGIDHNHCGEGNTMSAGK